MGRTKDKKQIPAYVMERDGFYLLLRIQMEKRGSRNINGVGREFFAPETYKKGKQILAHLIKKDLVTEKDGNILLREGLKNALNLILNAPHCMNFQNSLLHQKGQILTFYYADGAYAGVLIDKKNTMLVVTEEKDALYKAFEKQLEDKQISKDRKPEQWDRLWSKGEDTKDFKGIPKPVRAARITHCGNRMSRERFQTALLADRRQIQVIRGADSLSEKDLNRETVPAEDWYGVILRELERLKIESQGKGADGPGCEKEKKPEEKSEYKQVIENPGFPKSRTGFFFWWLKRMIIGFPRMLFGMVCRRSLALLLYPLWGVFLFFYNLCITCYVNDTFMLERRAKLGNLSPYLMAGTLRTPSYLKGFQVNWGLIDTSFLVWPLVMITTLLLRHLVLHLWKKKAGFFAELRKIPEGVRECTEHGYGKGSSVWKVLAAVWILGFVTMNPITIVLMSVLAFLIFAQGSGSGLVQTAFLWECAGSRKKVDAGEQPEPDSRKYRMLVFYAGAGLGLYGFVSLLLWFTVDYNWWIRLAVTVLMVLFALLQIFMSKGHSGKAQARTYVLIFAVLLLLGALIFTAGNAGVVFADDGGWTESGNTLAGLLNNAGFSTILGISILTIGLGLGLPLLGVGAVSLLIGGGTFITGLTNTEAGEYVRKSAEQYFFGTDPGEEKTIFCSATEFLNFVSGFVNPTAGMTGTTLKVFQGGKLVGDTVSTIGDIAGTINDAVSAWEKSGDWGTVAWDGIGVVLDIVGMKGDFDDFKKVLGNPSLTGRDLNDLLGEQYKDIQNRCQNDLENLGNRLEGQKQADIHAENLRHQDKMDSIMNDIQRLENGDLTPPDGIDQDTFLNTLKRTLEEEKGINSNNLYHIQNGYESNLQRQAEQILKTYGQEKINLMQKAAKDVVKDHWYEIGSKVKDAMSTPGDSGAGGGGDLLQGGAGTGSAGSGIGGGVGSGDLLQGGIGGGPADPGIAGSAGTGPVDLSMEEVIDMLEELPEEDLERLLVWMKEYLEENNTP